MSTKNDNIMKIKFKHFAASLKRFRQYLVMREPMHVFKTKKIVTFVQHV